MLTMTQRVSLQSILLTVALIVSSMLFSVPAHAGNQSNPSVVKHDLLFVSPGPDGKQVCVEQRTDGDNRKTVHKHKRANNAIQWAIKHGRRTVILGGTYRLTEKIQIKHDERTLVVGPEAKLKVVPERDGKWNAVIQVHRANNVRVFSFGLLDANTTTWSSGVQFFGRREDGQFGVKGGLLFATSDVRNVSGGYSVTQTQDMTVPLLAAKHYGGNLLTSALNHDQDLGTVAGLATPDQGGEGEVIDFNRYEKRAQVDRVIGPAPTVADEIVDINHCHNLTIDHIQAFLGTGHDGRLVVGYDLYGKKDLTRPHLERNKRINTKKIDRNRKEVDHFTKNVSLPGFPEQLPTLRADVDIIVQFEDGSKRTLLDRSYEFDL